MIIILKDVLNRRIIEVEHRVQIKRTVLRPKEDKIKDKYGNNIFISLRPSYN
jgi:hypothetical protein